MTKQELYRRLYNYIDDNKGADGLWFDEIEQCQILELLKPLIKPKEEIEAAELVIDNKDKFAKEKRALLPYLLEADEGLTAKEVNTIFEDALAEQPDDKTYQKLSTITGIALKGIFKDDKRFEQIDKVVKETSFGKQTNKAYRIRKRL